jgi:hypothetical protein
VLPLLNFGLCHNNDFDMLHRQSHAYSIVRRTPVLNVACNTVRRNEYPVCARTMLELRREFAHMIRANWIRPVLALNEKKVFEKWKSSA